MRDKTFSVEELIQDPSNIKFAYQPIWDIEHMSVLGYEALMRPFPFTPIEFIEELAARDRLQFLEEITNYYGSKQFLEANLDGYLFLNSCPSVGMSLEWSQKCMELGGEKMKPRLAYEMLEYSNPDNFAWKLKQKCFQEYGTNPLIVIDDFGTGWNFDFQCIEYYQPDIVKIDRAYITNIDSDPVNQEIVQQICAELKNRKIKVLAEGIETAAEFLYLKSLQIDYAQGYYLGKPLLSEEYREQQAKAEILDAIRKKIAV